jgi:hypothetical protein
MKPFAYECINNQLEFVGLAGIQELILGLAEMLTATIGSHILSRRANQEDWISRHCAAIMDAEDLTNVVVAKKCIQVNVLMATVGCL